MGAVQGGGRIFVTSLH